MKGINIAVKTMKGVGSMNENLITIPQLCKELGIGRTTAYKMIKSDQLAHGYLGRKIVIHRSEVERYNTDHEDEELIEMENALWEKLP